MGPSIYASTGALPAAESRAKKAARPPIAGAGCRVQGAGCRVQGAGCRVSVSGCGVWGVRGEVWVARQARRPPAYPRFISRPPWRQAKGKWMISLVTSHTNAIFNSQHLWDIDLRFSPGLPPMWRAAGLFQVQGVREWIVQIRGVGLGWALRG